MTDEIEWARKVCDAGTPGPWETRRGGDVSRYYLVDGAIGSPGISVAMQPRFAVDREWKLDATTIALFGSIGGELLAVAKASAECRAAGDYEGDGWAARCTTAEHMVNAALDALHAAIQTHRERTET